MSRLLDYYDHENKTRRSVMAWQILINHILSLFSLVVLGITLPALFVAIKQLWLWGED